MGVEEGGYITLAEIPFIKDESSGPWLRAVRSRGVMDRHPT